MPKKKRTSLGESSRTAVGVTRANFEAGDVVLEVSTNRLGRVCRVVTSGLSYNVRFSDDTQCSVVTQSMLRPAPSGKLGPDCTPDC